MKKIMLLLVFLVLVTGITAQSPLSFNYQAVMRDSGGNIISNQHVAVQIDILHGGIDGSVVFSETHQAQTNEFGLISLQIGSVASMETISWASGPFFMRVSIDGEIMGESQLLSVPFAMHAKTSADAFSADYNDLVNVPDFGQYIQIEDAQHGDLIFFNADSWQLIRLGAEGQGLSVVEGSPQWADLPDYGGDDPNDPDDPDVVIDIDGNVYPTVIIGNQKWMAANLRTTKYQDGSPLLTGLADEVWNGVPDGAYAIYPHSGITGINSSEEMVAAYGLLYNWNAAADTRNVCPAGWRVPSRQDFQILKDYLIDNHGHINIDNVGNALKHCRQVNSPLGGECTTDLHPRWNSHGFAFGNNESGFNSLPAGFRGWAGVYSSIGVNGIYWSSTSGTATNAWCFRLINTNGFAEEQNTTKKTGYSIRCIKNDE
jgi:uncharacterized protein (TIGR02145 family)